MTPEPRIFDDPTEHEPQPDAFECPMCGGIGRVFRITDAVSAAIEAGAVAIVPTPHPDAGRLDRNHYDRFTEREAACLLSDEGLAETHRKFSEGLTDPFVHDAAKVVVELVEALQRSRDELGEQR